VTTRRPRRQVSISVKITAPASNGYQPPSLILTTLAPKKARSTIRNPAASSAVHHGCQPQRRATKNASTVVITMSVEIATP
jgi:hypothetical protein